MTGRTPDEVVGTASQPAQRLVEVNMRTPVMSCAWWAVLVLPAVGETYVVRPDGTGDFPTIQAAVDAAAGGDTIELTDGVFRGEGNRRVFWVGKEITLRSQSGDPRACILDPERQDFGIYLDNVGPGALLEGITIRNGYGSYGGGVHVLQSQPRIDRCVFLDNVGGDGGGLLVNGGAARPTITACAFAGNFAFFSGSGIDM